MRFRINFIFPLAKSIDLYDNLNDSRFTLCILSIDEVTPWIKIPLSIF